MEPKALTFGKSTVEAVEALPDQATAGVCSCGGTQFRLYQTKDTWHALCPTCGTVFQTS